MYFKDGEYYNDTYNEINKWRIGNILSVFEFYTTLNSSCNIELDSTFQDIDSEGYFNYNNITLYTLNDTTCLFSFSVNDYTPTPSPCPSPLLPPHIITPKQTFHPSVNVGVMFGVNCSVRVYNCPPSFHLVSVNSTYDTCVAGMHYLHFYRQ